MIEQSQKSKFLNISQEIRKVVLELIYKTKSPHIGPSFSIVEMLVALYFKHLNVFPENPTHPLRDRFILSKGHACATLYAVLCAKEFFKKEELDTFSINNGIFAHHPIMDLKRGIELSTGSLGHGLSVGTGMALAAKNDQNQYKIYVMLSDGELNEGSVWESIMFGGHHHLSNVVAIVDANKIQALGHTASIINLQPLGEKWTSFGWHVQEIDGHDFDEIFSALKGLSNDKPNVIVMNTVKGKGVSFMEDQLLWHYRAPDDDEYSRALLELQK